MASDENESFASQRPSKTGFVVCFNVPLNKSAFVLRSSKVPKPEKSTFKVTVQNLAEIKFVVETFSKIMNAKTFPMYLQGDVGVHKRLESSPSISGRTRSTSGSCSSWIASVSASGLRIHRTSFALRAIGGPLIRVREWFRAAEGELFAGTFGRRGSS